VRRAPHRPSGRSAPPSIQLSIGEQPNRVRVANLDGLRRRFAVQS